MIYNRTKGKKKKQLFLLLTSNVDKRHLPYLLYVLLCTCYGYVVVVVVVYMLLLL